jgi:hypothetical protein
MAIKDLFDNITNLEKKVKELFPKQRGRVLITNAKQNVDYTLGALNEKNTYEWNARYCEELQKLV